MNSYDSFSITTIDVDKYNNKVIINFNQDVCQNDINIDNIVLLNKKNGVLLEYTLKPCGKYVEVLLKDYPDPTNSYLLYVNNIRNVLEEPLDSGLERTINFVNTISSVINIISPSNFEKVNGVIIKWEEINKDNVYVNSYYLEVSDDIGFYNIIRKTNVITDKEIDFGSFNEGQYYVRCRAQNDEDFGLWSSVITFLVQTTGTETPIDNPFPEPDIYPVYQKELSIISMPENGETPSSFIIEFDDKIDPATLGNIVIFRREL